MAIAYVGSTSHSGDWASSLTKALDAGVADDRCVIVLAVTDRGGATTISGATYGGVAMTAHTSFTSSLTSFDGRFFYLGGAASGSNDIVVTYSDGNTKPKFLAAAYSGVDGTTPIDQLNNYAVNTASPSATVTSAAGDLVVFMFAYNGRTAVTASSPATERFDADMGLGIYGYLMDEAGAASVTIDGSVTGGNAEIWGASFNLNAASAGATGVPATNRLLMGVG